MTFSSQQFQQLPLLHQHLIGLLSVIYQPIAATPLAQCVNKLIENYGIEGHDLRPETANSWNYRLLSEELAKLTEENGVLITDKRYHLEEDLLEPVTLFTIQHERFELYAEIILTYFPAPNNTYGNNAWKSFESALSHTRLHLFSGDFVQLKNTLNSLYHQYAQEPEFTDPFTAILGESPTQQQLSVINDDVFIRAVAFSLLNQPLSSNNHSEIVCQELKDRYQKTDNPTIKQLCADLLAPEAILRGQFDDLPERPKDAYFQASWAATDATIHLLKGDIEKGQKLFSAAEKQLRKTLKKRSLSFFDSSVEAIYTLSVAGKHESFDGNVVRQYIANLEHRHYFLSVILSSYYLTFIDGDENDTQKLLETISIKGDALLAIGLQCIHYWSDIPIKQERLIELELLYNQALSNQYLWMAAEISSGLALLDQNPTQNWTEISQQLHEQIGSQSLFKLRNKESRWVRALNALSMLADQNSQSNTTKGDERLVWILQENYAEDIGIQPKIQKRGKNGRWSKGRNASLSRLYNEQDYLSYLTDEDKALCQCIQEYRDTYYYSNASYEFDESRIWPALVNHPRVFWDHARDTPVEILHGEPELVVSEHGDMIKMTLYPELDDYNTGANNYILVRETPTRIRVYDINEQHYQIQRIIGSCQHYPKEAEEQLRETLRTLAPTLTIHSDITGLDDAKEVTADPRIHVHLLPYGDGLRLSLRVQPFGEDIGPLYPPAQGRHTLVTTTEDEKLKTRRNFELEQEHLDTLLEHAEVLDQESDDKHNDEISLEDPQDALEAITQLHQLNENIVLKWPEGEVMRITRQLDSNNMRIKITQEGDWFELEGEVEVSEGLVMSLKQLMSLNEANPGRFLKLEEGQYIALTSTLRKRLDALSAYSDEAKGDTARISSLASLSLEDFLEDVGELESDGKWQEQVKHLNNLRTVQHTVPSVLQTELRDYQVDGFEWMARLADWGVGACLADDMGLGKTIQSLALILTRSSQGPTLVIAPVSVCNNWDSETRKFAPTLNPIFYRGNNRQQLIESLTANDLVICSYGLLQQDGELLAEQHWRTIILDEAQAIKNVGAKRTKAAWALQGDFKLITTGTPIENHLGELWSLFRFINPGLLGSQDNFTRKYIYPIERYKDKNASYHLRRLIQPFILRRTKTQVLSELPPRTEITLEVPLSSEERALYEAVRQQALDKLKNSTEDDISHIQVLAEITKLRLASCHPKLVMEDTPLEGSKLKAFSNLIDELQENNHKALVFSQFVKHLAIIREYLDSAGISYQYLDGSTPMTKRKQAVDDFQSGIGDVFLISLKAGGSGLNLTAADYVIHMDPWWNPAVEDQASDRAHRIGQQRPVTIYRLVAENTIEEKIVKLHQHKRDLANNLLEGSDISGKMKAEDMLKLIRGD